MSRVKMNAKQEYEYLQNYKVLQTFFKTKKIDKVCDQLRYTRITLTMLPIAYTGRETGEMQDAVSGLFTLCTRVARSLFPS